MERQMNVHVGFRAVFEAPPPGPVVLRITASSLYRVFVNGKFRGHGPARGPHGWFRVDEWTIDGNLKPGANLVAVEVAGYNVNSYYLLDQPAFLQAEVVADNRVLAATGGTGAFWEASLLAEHVRKVQRYSFQRPFSEVYRMAPGFDAWRRDRGARFMKIECAVQPGGKLLPRRVPYPDFTVRPALALVSRGELHRGAPPEKPWKNRSLTGIGPDLKGFPEKELETIPSLELQSVANMSRVAENRPLSPGERLHLNRDSYALLDFGMNVSGFIGIRVRCARKTRLFLTFDEVLTGDDVDFKRGRSINVLAYELMPGDYRLESLEPYTVRYLKLLVLDGDCEAAGAYVREYTNPNVWQAQFQSSDGRLNKLFAAARETCRQNAVDLFMDCPSRERAGWSGDSYFASRASARLSGDTVIEKAFLENYLLPERFEHLPEGMLPMAYPADHYNGSFIPTFAFWFVLELEEYLGRSGDRQMVEAFRPRVLKLLRYFEKFLNSDGLLEDLEGWIFIEWSEANNYVKGVNYPSNMLFAAALAAAGRMYGLPRLAEQAEGVRDKIRKQSFDGEFFVDNALRSGGKLQSTRNRTEVCQYFAFYFGVASPKTHGPLWASLWRDFGPGRSERKLFPDVAPANIIFGRLLRLELLARENLAQQLVDETVAGWLYMAERTGTLWERPNAESSTNHGLTAHMAHLIYRDVLGLSKLDLFGKTIQVRFNRLNLAWCEGRIPTPDGDVTISWRRENGELHYRVEAPQGYKVAVDNQTGLTVHRFAQRDGA